MQRADPEITLRFARADEEIAVDQLLVLHAEHAGGVALHGGQPFTLRIGAGREPRARLFEMFERERAVEVDDDGQVHRLEEGKLHQREALHDEHVGVLREPPDAGRIVRIVGRERAARVVDLGDAGRRDGDARDGGERLAHFEHAHRGAGHVTRERLVSDDQQARARAKDFRQFLCLHECLLNPAVGAERRYQFERPSEPRQDVAIVRGPPCLHRRARSCERRQRFHRRAQRAERFERQAAHG